MSNYKYKSNAEFLKVADKLTEKEWAELYNEEMKKDPAYGDGENFKTDFMTRGLNERERTIMNHIRENITPMGESLDIGCANGRFVKEMGDYGFIAIGLEVAQDMVDLGNKYFKNENRREIILSENILSFKVIIPSQVITCCETLEHIPDWQLAINSMLKLLQFDGTMYLTVPYKNKIGSPYHLHSFDEHWLDYLNNEWHIETTIHDTWMLSIIKWKGYDES